MRRLLFALLIISTFAFAAQARAPRVGFVLSGGGARGIAHAGVIQAFEENGIFPDYIAGTSMGAIVGGLYSCGYSPAEMMELFTSEGFSHWSTGEIDPELYDYIYRPSENGTWFKANFKFKNGFRINSNTFPGSLISPLPMNCEFVRLFAPYTVRCNANFDNLFVPFRCVTSDIYHKHKIVCRNGSVADAVRESMSFPMVFKPIERDSVLVYDGGIYDNFPVDVMTEDFNPDIILGISVSKPDGKPQQNNLYSQVQDMIIQNNNYDLDPAKGIKIQVPVQQYQVLDFNQAQEIYEIGYRTGLQYVDSIKHRYGDKLRPRDIAAERKAWNESVKPLAVDRVEGAERGLENFMVPPMDVKTLKENYYSAISTNRYSDLYMRLTDGTLKLFPSYKDRFICGLGGWLTTSAQSRILIDMEFSDFIKSKHLTSVNLRGWLGQCYFAADLSGRFYLPTHLPSYLEVEGVVSRTKLYDEEQHFWNWDSSQHARTTEGFGRLTYAIRAGRNGKALLSLTYGYLKNTVSAGLESAETFSYHPATISVGYQSNTLDNNTYPSEGQYIKATINGELMKSGKMDGKYALKGFLSFKHYFKLSKYWHMGINAEGSVALKAKRQNYSAALLLERPFEPMPSMCNYLMDGFRSDNYVAVGLSPVWSPMNNLQFRGDLYWYVPVRSVVLNENEAGLPLSREKWFPRQQGAFEVTALYNFPFATLALYANYLTCPKRNWNVGLNFGFYLDAPRLLR